MSEYKQCPNGHYYQGDHCPYCKNSGNASGSAKTEVFSNPDNFAGQQPTMTNERSAETYTGNTSGGVKTTMVDGATIVGGAVAGGSPAPQNAGNGPVRVQVSSHTVFGNDDELENVSTPNGGMRTQRVYREVRKLVGWLVSYTLDPMGVDFKLYEGRNIIGRDMDCNITVNDNMVSSKHAVLLFRAGKYSVTDSQSSHGTFVNDVDIELEPYYLQDGDVIKVGQTVFKFRTSF